MGNPATTSVTAPASSPTLVKSFFENESGFSVDVDLPTGDSAEVGFAVFEAFQSAKLTGAVGTSAEAVDCPAFQSAKLIGAVVAIA